MGSKQTTLIISNQTKFDIVKIVTTVENNNHWDGSDRPDNNFNTERDATVKIKQGTSLSKREELNAGIFSTEKGAYTMTLFFSNGDKIKFNNDQKDALDGYSRNNYWLSDDSSKGYSLFQSAGSGINKFEVRRARRAENKAWMSEMDDNKLLNHLSIPGSHDSGCHDSNGVIDWVATQVLDIEGQLNAGIRYFDLRGFADGKLSKYVILTNDSFDGDRNCQICHAAIRQLDTFKGFFNTIINFLERNDKETVIVQVRKDNGDKNLQDIMTNLIADLGGNKHFYDGKDMPRLGDVRKRIVLTNREGNKWGYDLSGWGNNDKLELQDNYDPSVGFFESRKNKKIHDIKEFHTKYAYQHNNKLKLNFLSMASATDGWWTALSYSKDINPEILNFLRTQPSGYASVFLMDGVGSTDETKDLVNIIINNNY